MSKIGHGINKKFDRFVQVRINLIQSTQEFVGMAGKTEYDPEHVILEKVNLT